MPLFCNCAEKTYMKGTLDKLFWKLYGECSKCRLSLEGKLKRNGKWKFSLLQENTKPILHSAEPTDGLYSTSSIEMLDNLSSTASRKTKKKRTTKKKTTSKKKEE